MQKHGDHILLRSINLVALGIFVYIRPHLVPRLREFDSESIKVECINLDWADGYSCQQRWYRSSLQN